MSLTGSFSTMPLAEVLGWIGTTNRLGVLTLHGVGCETRMHLQAGRVFECESSDPPVLLGQYLMFHGVIDEDVLYRAMCAHAEQRRRLGDVLLEMGAVSAEDLSEALLAKAEETVLGAFDHATGWFTFDPNLASLEAPQELDMSITEAIARGHTRVTSAAVATDLLKRSGSVLRKTGKAPSAKLSSVWPLRKAYALVDGERTIDEIVLHMHGTEFHVIQRLHQLFLEGFIEVVEGDETMPSSASDSASNSIQTLEAMQASFRVDPSRVALSSALEGIIPIAMPPEFIQESGNLSIIEKYLLTLCDGTRDLQRITTVAPVQSQLVVETIRSLQNRGWLQAMPPLSDH
jgi:hypothetical protein